MTSVDSDLDVNTSTAFQGLSLDKVHQFDGKISDSNRVVPIEQSLVNLLLSDFETTASHIVLAD